ncbi:GNAT family N-acetyltransferase [Marinoscillum furvescens]|uniref:L-amino acid N-acyltransferase YncA n=1 Tax=Marinoscillum furvescens DSM 4134 TaxID=1122208 RepID=A0A3D9L2E5_MARFU|nr:GNAT family N-acetyltransferase [Marinoscillum furvescens]RED97869.1 L-amino acid N-acyltransferase YncA [Marinoscillum furvescens DSM 4134]
MIRKATRADYDAVWEIFHQVIQSGDTYVFDPQTPKADLEKHWFADYMHTYVYEAAGEVLGTYILKPNQLGRGSHVANGSYMVHPKAHGQGIGKKLCAHSLQEAERLGFKAIQFNLVVSTNTAAIHLWQKYGFEIVGRLPKAFDHADLGLVDALVMYREV